MWLVSGSCSALPQMGNIWRIIRCYFAFLSPVGEWPLPTSQDLLFHHGSFYSCFNGALEKPLKLFFFLFFLGESYSYKIFQQGHMTAFCLDEKQLPFPFFQMKVPFLWASTSLLTTIKLLLSWKAEWVEGEVGWNNKFQISYPTAAVVIRVAPKPSSTIPLKKLYWVKVRG